MSAFVHASVQVAEGLAKPPPFPYSCGLTGGNQRKRIDYHSTITSLHCTTKAHPSIPAVGEREERTALTTTTTTTNRHEENTAGRREGGKEGGGGEGERRRKRKGTRTSEQMREERFSSPAMGRLKDGDGRGGERREERE